MMNRNSLVLLLAFGVFQISTVFCYMGETHTQHWPPWNKFVPALRVSNSMTWYPNSLTCTGLDEDDAGCLPNIVTACVQGMYVAYDDVGFNIIDSSNLIYFGLADCVDILDRQLTPISFASYQAIGSTSDIYEDSISFFPNVNLGGEATVYTEYYHTNNISLPENFKSLVIHGSSTWILTTDIVYGTVNLRERVCLIVPYTPMNYPGFVADIYGELGFNQIVTRVIRQDDGCPEGANGLYLRTYTVNIVVLPLGTNPTNVVDSNGVAEIGGLA